MTQKPMANSTFGSELVTPRIASSLIKGNSRDKTHPHSTQTKRSPNKTGVTLRKPKACESEVRPRGGKRDARANKDPYKRGTGRKRKALRGNLNLRRSVTDV